MVYIYIAVSTVSPICSSSDVTGLTAFFSLCKSLGPVTAIPTAPKGAVSKITSTANVNICQNRKKIGVQKRINKTQRYNKMQRLFCKIAPFISLYSFHKTFIPTPILLTYIFTIVFLRLFRVTLFSRGF